MCASQLNPLLSGLVDDTGLLTDMTTFTIGDRDLEPLIRRDLWNELRHQGPLPLGALVAAAVLVWVHPFLGAVALGMGIAWGYSLVAHLRSVRRMYRLRQGSLAGELTVKFLEEGVWTGMPLLQAQLALTIACKGPN